MNRGLIITFLIAFLYVGIGTGALFFINSSSILVPIALLLTLPVSFVGFGIAYSEYDSQILILIVQFFVFLLTWAILYYTMVKSKNGLFGNKSET